MLNGNAELSKGSSMLSLPANEGFCKSGKALRFLYNANWIKRLPGGIIKASFPLVLRLIRLTNDAVN